MVPIQLFRNRLHTFSKLLVWLLGLTVTAACASHAVRTFVFSLEHEVGETFMGIRWQGTLELPNITVNGIRLTELSGLAWDDDDGLLYAVSDQGYLFHLQPEITHRVLTNVTIITAYPLTNKKGKRYANRDAEGLTIIRSNNGIKGDSELIISFERQPTIARFSTTGKWLKTYRLPSLLRDIDNYAGSNTALEAVTLHPTWGILTAPEQPLTTPPLAKNGRFNVIYTLADGGKHSWTFPVAPASNSAIVALEALADGSVLVLERSFISVWQPLIISLRQLWLTECQQCSQAPATVKLIAEFNNQKGWNLDNFEGLTQQSGPYFFMVSDDNDSALQHTLLTYFELLPD